MRPILGATQMSTFLHTRQRGEANTPKRRKQFSKSAYIISDVFKFLCKKFDKFTLISAPGNLPVWQSHD